MLILYCVSHAFASAHWCLLVTCWERAYLLVLVCGVENCVVVTFPFGILCQVWYLIVPIPDFCPFSYFHTVRIVLHILAALVQCQGHRMHTT